MIKQCKCGAKLVGDVPPEYCEFCETFTHPVYVKASLDGKSLEEIEALYANRVKK